ncbi:polysaccharide lyase 8 family protein [Actinomadura sp. ATCC 31491]|uniref:Polysaccharide lyase 8 family protein n=1 Tax=Actinomadura luzonensis TaxID=2805427 RepID=A0ABT0FL48_9ACTN|nr:polysaccharide lyase 8 family protein [Actinomadura luzonensis]MCK2213047.1 polysaccharide lyase 8 family protein [Actinomadura luzonensis]
MEPFATLRAAALSLLTGGDLDAADPAYAAPLARLSGAAAGRLASLTPALTWPDLPLEGRPGNVTGSHARLRVIATAWATPGTAQHGDDGVAATVVAALDLLHERHYHAGLPETGNWWFWEIGTPAELSRTCVLLGDRLDAGRLEAYLGAIDRFCPDADRRAGNPAAAESGANRADKALVVALRGVAGRSAEKLALARDGLSDVRDGGRHSVFRHVESGDGFYPDGSFIQHGDVAYTGSYGLSLLIAVAHTLALLEGSPWAVRDPGRRLLLDAVERSFAPFVHDGLLMDAVRGRAVSRQAFSDAVAGHGLVGAVLLLGEHAPEPYRGRFAELAKGWIERGKHRPYLEHADVPETRRAVAVLDDKAVEAAGPPVGHHVFASMDRVVHRQPAWSFAISLSSRRIAAYEAINGENRHAWYTGDGMTYLYTGDLGQFGDDFWPTVDPHRLPGTTVAVRPREDLSFRAHRPENDWAGGAALDGRYGAAAMELTGDGVYLRARKSWFCLDNVVVALGAGITATGGHPVETVVENRATGARPYVGDGWAHLPDTGGYVFEGGLHLVTERTGRWRDINTGDDTAGAYDPVTRRYVTFWIDHGVDPVDASYAYVILPHATRERTRAWRGAWPVRVAANTPRVQAVRGRALVAATFWAAGRIDGLEADAPCVVLMRRTAGRVAVAVADPSRTVDHVTVTLDRPARGVVRADDTVTVRTGNRPRLTVALAGSGGRTHAAELSAYGPRTPQGDR